jgi:LysM repeat protein
MNNANPLVPQGSLLDQTARSKPHLRVALCIVAVHVVFLGLLLMQGCKPEDQTQRLADSATNETTLAPLDVASLFPTNLPPEPTNALAQDLTRTGMVDAFSGLVGTPPPTNMIVPPPVDLSGPREHTVARGDNFTTIARKYGVTPAAISRANPGVDSTRLRIDQKLVIPPPTSDAGAAAPAPGVAVATSDVYQVKAGDNLSRIARMHGTTPAAIRELNGLLTDRIYAGQKLKLPARSGGGTP